MTHVESILVVRLSSLGDIVLALPTVDALRSHWPGAHIAFLARAPFGSILREARSIDRLFVWDGPGAPVPEEVRVRTWDLIVDLSATGRSRRLLMGIPARRTLRTRKETLRRFAFVRLRAFGGARVSISSAMDRMAAALVPLGLDRGGRTPSLVPPVPRDDRLVLLAPGGGRGAKRWPAEHFAETARRLVHRGFRLLVIGGLEEKELLDDVVRGIAPGHVRVIAGAETASLPGLLAPCSVAVTNDSGLLHVAEACGVPVVALFGPTHPRLGFAPWRADSVALHTGISCSPCDPHGPEVCPRGHHRCMKSIEVETVVSAVLSRHVGEPAL